MITKKYSNKRAYIIIGLGYGDEGKGLTTDYLCQQSYQPLVIRFNGGQQAGHTVVHEDGRRHVFSNLGAGSLSLVPTYWSRFCTFSPIHFLEEYQQLPRQPQIYIDKNSPVTTHYDILFSRAVETSRGSSRHGSCGVGFGATVDRNKHPNLLFSAGEFVNVRICKERLKAIRNYYEHKFKYETIFDFGQFDHDQEDKTFMEDIQAINKLQATGQVVFLEEREIFENKRWSTYIFEGAQGILLDMEFGEQPHITKSNTTSKNAMELLRRNFQLEDIDINIFYVTRAYSTRHGAGPFNDSFGSPVLRNNESETNIENEFQGKLRSAFLQASQLNKALAYDNLFTSSLRKNLIVTCMDQLDAPVIELIVEDKLVMVDPVDLQQYLKASFDNIKFSYGPQASDIL